MDNKEYLEEKILYVIGLISIFCVLVIFIIMHIYNINIYDINIPCVVFQKTGYYCPGCGGTRAIKALLQGDLISSFRYHPAILYIAVLGSMFMLLNTISLILKKNFSGMRIKTSLILLIPAIIVVQFIVKNLLLIIYNIKII